jgi:hypothetical protein
MTFEEPLLDKAQKELESTQKLCSEHKKMLSSIKKAFSSSSSSSKNYQDNNNNTNSTEKLEDKFTKAIILADCKLFLAMLTFIRQDITGYLANGILQIRKSWKAYARIHKQLYSLYKEIDPKNAEQTYGSDPNTNQLDNWLKEDDENETKPTDNSLNNDDKNANPVEIDTLSIEEDETKIDASTMSVDTIKRLLGAVSFGYGLFQICLSFMPPNVLKLIKFLGFEGDREYAIKAINFTSISGDMRAPFADIVLIWYSVIATPQLGISEGEFIINFENALQIIEKNLSKYPNSSIFFYMKGRYCRAAHSDLKGSMKCFEIASEKSKHIRQIQFISIFEIGWLFLMDLDYKNAFIQFDILSKESKWSKAYNYYASAILSGANNDLKQANAYCKEGLKVFNKQTRKPNPIELFAVKRLEYFKKNPFDSKKICQLLCIELLYNWVCIPYCTKGKLEEMLKICDEITEKQFVPFKCLFEGHIQIALKNRDFGEQVTFSFLISFYFIS